MRGSGVGDVIKVWVWAVGSLALGLWLTPAAFNGGKAISELSQSKDFSGMMNKFAAWSGGAGLEDFFKICWPLSGLLLLFPLIEWMRVGNDRARENALDVRVPEDAELAEVVEYVPRKPMYGSDRLAIVFGSVILVAVVLVNAASFINFPGATALSEGIWIDTGAALTIALLAEMFFRRVVLGIFLHAMRPWFAIGLAALMFGLIPFILSGFENASRLDGETLSAIQLSAVLFGGGDFFTRFIFVFLPWCGFSFVLGWARWRTASAWLFTGMLTAWLLVDRLYSKATQAFENPGQVAPSFATKSNYDGIIPLLGVVVIGGMAYLITHGYPFKCNAKAGD